MLWLMPKEQLPGLSVSKPARPNRPTGASSPRRCSREAIAACLQAATACSAGPSGSRAPRHHSPSRGVAAAFWSRHPHVPGLRLTGAIALSVRHDRQVNTPNALAADGHPYGA